MPFVVCAMVRMVLDSDELEQRIHLVGLVIAGIGRHQLGDEQLGMLVGTAAGLAAGPGAGFVSTPAPAFGGAS